MKRNESPPLLDACLAISSVLGRSALETADAAIRAHVTMSFLVGRLGGDNARGELGVNTTGAMSEKKAS